MPEERRINVRVTREELAVLIRGCQKVKWSHDHVGLAKTNIHRQANEDVLEKLYGYARRADQGSTRNGS